MKFILLFVLCFLVMTSLSGLEKTVSPAVPKTEAEEIMVQISRQDGTVESVDLESYVTGVVSAEMPASFDLEALKAQAVASRTFVMARDLKVDDTTSSQVYYDKAQRQNNWQGDYDTYEKKIETAVEETAGEVLMYDGQYISALFFSSSNGKTENNNDYFASAGIPYLTSVDSQWDLAYDGTFREKTFTLDELNTLFGTEQFDLQIISYTQSGRVQEVDVCGTLYTGREIREKLGLASADFDVSREGDVYTFETVGFGHGVGMSQYGANGMAADGYTYDEILKHYYQGVTIEKINEK